MASKQDMTAIIYDRRGRVLSVGKNSYFKTHTLQAKHAAKVGTPGCPRYTKMDLIHIN